MPSLRPDPPSVPALLEESAARGVDVKPTAAGFSAYSLQGAEHRRAGGRARAGRGVPRGSRTRRSRDRRRAGNRQDDVWQEAVEPRSGARRERADRAAGGVGGEALVRGSRRSARRRIADDALRVDPGRSARRSTSRCCARRREPCARADDVRRHRVALAPARAAAGGSRSCSRSTTSSGSTLPRRQRSSSRCAGSGGARPSVFSVRRDGGRPSARSRRFERDAPVERLELGPLSVAALHRMLTQDARARRSRDRRSCGSRRRRGGNPLYALEIARDSTGASGRTMTRAALPVPDEPRRARRERASERFRRDARRAAARRCPGAARHASRRRGRARARRGGGARARRGGRTDRVRPPALRVGRLLVGAGSAGAARLTARSPTLVARPGGARPPPRTRQRRGRTRGSRGSSRRLPRHARMRGAPDTAAELTELALRLLPRRALRATSSGSSSPSTSISRATSSARGRCSRSCARRSSPATCARERC